VTELLEDQHLIFDKGECVVFTYINTHLARRAFLLIDLGDRNGYLLFVFGLAPEEEVNIGFFHIAVEETHTFLEGES
jgi:hypothetical protein